MVTRPHRWSDLFPRFDLLVDLAHVAAGPVLSVHDKGVGGRAYSHSEAAVTRLGPNETGLQSVATRVLLRVYEMAEKFRAVREAHA